MLHATARLDILTRHTIGVAHADNAEEYDSEESDSDEDEEYGEGINGMYDGEDSDEEESDDSDEADDGFVHRSSVIIEEVQDGEGDVAHVTTTAAAKVSVIMDIMFTV